MPPPSRPTGPKPNLPAAVQPPPGQVAGQRPIGDATLNQPGPPDGELQTRIVLNAENRTGDADLAAQATGTQEASIDLGDLHGHYRLAGELGRGGMGAIYKVQDQTINRTIAMKVLVRSGDPLQRLRFREEAQVTGQLEHPGIVPVHEFGSDKRGHLYFTMKLVNGRSMAEIITQMRERDQATIEEFTLTKMLKILVDVSNAIAFAHFRGVIHRDIKPANIMIGRFGEVQVMDWGLAKVIAKGQDDLARVAQLSASGAPHRGPARGATRPAADDLVSESRSAGLNTLDGTIIGTPAYMAPEQAQGDSALITTRTDIYTLGALLYEMLTLTPPYRGDSAKSLIAQVIDGHREPPERRAPERNIPRELSAIAMKALEVDPQRRYATVESFKADIELYLDGRAVTAKVDSLVETIGKLMRRNRVASVAILIASVLIFAVVCIAFSMTLADQRRAERKELEARHAQAEAEMNLDKFVLEQQARQLAEHAAAPGLILQARDYVEHQRFTDANRALELALSFDSSSAEALLLRAQIALVGHDSVLASQALRAYLALRPNDQHSQLLLRLAVQSRGDAVSPTLDAAICAILSQQGATHLATVLAGSFDAQLPLIRQQLDRAWPGAGDQLQVRPGNALELNLHDFRASVSDLAVLRNVPISFLYLKECDRIADLTPLSGMPLEWLVLDQCAKIPDISALAGMRLRHVELRNLNRVKDFSVLKGMPLEYLDVSECTHFSDVSVLKNMPLKQLGVRSCALIQDFSPLAELPLEWLDIGNTRCSDIAPFARMPTLQTLYMGQTQVVNFAPLGQMHLQTLYLPLTPEMDGLERILRRQTTITTLNLMPVGDFWRKYDREHPRPAHP